MFQSGPSGFNGSYARLLHAPDDYRDGAFPDDIQFKEVTDLVNSRAVDPKLAFLMGSIYAGRSKELGDRYALELHNPQPKILEFVKDALDTYFPNSNPKIGIAKSQLTNVLTVNSRSLNRLFNFHTNNAEELPRHLLGSGDEKVAFIRGLFSFAGSVNHNGVTLGARLGKKSAVQIALLLDEIGVTPLVTEVNGYQRVVITDAVGLEQMQELKLFLDPERSAALTEHLSGKTGKVSVHPNKYYEFRDQYLEDPNKPVARIAQEIGVPETTARYWAKGNQPRAVTRAKKLRDLAKEMEIPESGAIVFGYREMGYSLSSSLELAQRFSAQELGEIVAVGEILGWDMKEDPGLVLDVGARFKDLMADVFHDTSLEDLDEKHIYEIERRGRLIQWAREQGVTASHFSTLVSQLLDNHFESVIPVTVKVHRDLRLEQYGVDIEAAKQIAAITLYDCLSSTFDPGKNPSLKSYGSQAVKFKLYNEFSRVSNTGRRVVQIAKAIAQDPKAFTTADEVEEHFGCKRNTAVHALHLARSQSQLSEQSADFTNQEMPYAHLEGKKEMNPQRKVELAELFQKALSVADSTDRLIVEGIYRDGLEPTELAKKLKIDPSELQNRLDDFYSRARIHLDS